MAKEEPITVEAVVIMKPGVTLLGRPDAPESVVIQAADSTQGIFCQGGDSTSVIAGITVTGGRSGLIGGNSALRASSAFFPLAGISGIGSTSLPILSGFCPMLSSFVASPLLAASFGSRADALHCGRAA